MHGRIPADGSASIFPADSSVSECCAGVRSDSAEKFTDSSDSESWFARLCRKLWPSKPAASLEFLTGARERQCYRYASGQQEPPALLVVELLRGTDGGRLLAEIMRGASPPWWSEYQFALAALPAVEQLRQLRLPLE